LARPTDSGTISPAAGCVPRPTWRTRGEWPARHWGPGRRLGDRRWPSFSPSSRSST